jgi:hypothetical protein
MAFDWSTIFDNFGVKPVRPTDKDKGAFVLNQEQKAAMTAAGFEPATGGNPSASEDDLLPVSVLFDRSTSSMRVSYYDSIRAGANRPPETRMGRGIVQWMHVGDVIVIGNVGSKLYVAKESEVVPSASDAGEELARKVDPKTVIARASQLTGIPQRKDRLVVDFVRRPLVVAGAILRAAGECEMPGCAHETFKRADGSVFLEVHHIKPLAERGEDTLLNAAALCPMCHRELHFGADRLSKRALLQAHVTQLGASL